MSSFKVLEVLLVLKAHLEKEVQSDLLALKDHVVNVEREAKGANPEPLELAAKEDLSALLDLPDLLVQLEPRVKEVHLERLVQMDNLVHKVKEDNLVKEAQMELLELLEDLVNEDVMVLLDHEDPLDQLVKEENVENAVDLV